MVIDRTMPRDDACDHFLVVAPSCLDQQLPGYLRDRFPDSRVSVCETYLSGLAHAVSRPTRFVLFCVDPGVARLPEAVAGFREALGARGRLIACCHTGTEPLARRAAQCGADDYVLFPLQNGELEAALGFRPSMTSVEPAPVVSLDELRQLGEVLSHLQDNPIDLLERTADWVRASMGASAATMVVQGSAVSSGNSVVKPVLCASLKEADRIVGQVLIGESPAGPYTAASAQKLEQYAVILGHVFEAARLQRHWKRLANTDDASGLPNRRSLRERLTDVLRDSAKERYPVTLLLFDIDDFKKYNDLHGHQVGDAVLNTVGQVFRRLCRPHDVVARFGGDEFAVVFWDVKGPRQPGSSHPDCALSVLDRVREELRKERIPGLRAGVDESLTISGGLATFPWDASSVDELIATADRALLSAKRAGKNRVIVIGSTASRGS